MGGKFYLYLVMLLLRYVVVPLSTAISFLTDLFKNKILSFVIDTLTYFDLSVHSTSYLKYQNFLSAILPVK